MDHIKRSDCHNLTALNAYICVSINFRIYSYTITLMVFLSSFCALFCSTPAQTSHTEYLYTLKQPQAWQGLQQGEV